MSLLISALHQTLMFLPLALGIYLSYRILNITDLTVEGTFVLGAALFARLLTTGHSEWVSLLGGLAGGMLAGIAVGLMQYFGRINSLIASILAVFMLYSINFQAMGRPNISLLDSSTLLTRMQNHNELQMWLVLALVVIVIVVGLCMMLHSRFGLLIRAFGNNSELLTHLGKPVWLYLLFGLALSNAMAALCGIITAQINGYADLNMGLGMALTAIGAVVIGQQLMHGLLPRESKYNALLDCISCFAGAFIYFLAMNLFLYWGINPVHLKFFLGLVLVLFLGIASYRHPNIHARWD